MIEKIRFIGNETVYDCELTYSFNLSKGIRRLTVSFVNLEVANEDGSTTTIAVPTEEQLVAGFESINEFSGDVQGLTDLYTSIYLKVSDTEYILTNKEDDVYVDPSLNPDSDDESIEHEYTKEELAAILTINKKNKIDLSKLLLSDFLENNPLVSTCHNGVEGKYAVTLEKQSLMTSQYMTYTIEKEINPDAILTWNETGKSCEVWTEAEFLQLVLEVKAYVYPLVSAQQAYEEAINACTTQEELDAIILVYPAPVADDTETEEPAEEEITNEEETTTEEPVAE